MTKKRLQKRIEYNPFISMYPSLPEEYWQGEPVNFTDYRSNAFKAGLLAYEDALPGFDLRSNSSRKVFIELGFQVNNRDDVNLKYLKGDFDVSSSAFNGGLMDEFITAYVAPGMAYKDVNISYYKIPTHSIDRDNFGERTQWSNYNETDNIYWHQSTLDSGEILWKRIARATRNGITSVKSREEFSNKDITLREINSMLKEDGIPEDINFLNFQIDYDSDELRGIFSVSDHHHKEIDVPVYKKWARKLWKLSDKDGIINVHIDESGSFKKRCRDISEAHADFLEDLLAEVSDTTGQEINYVNAEDADIVIYSKGKWLSNTKKRRTYFDVNMGALAKWQLDDQTKKSMSQHVLYCFGLNDISELADYSGDESLMLPWVEGYEYYGLTPSDITALQSVW